MRCFCYLLACIFFISTPVFAEDENQVPVIDPIAGDINARLQRVEKMLDNKALLDMLELLESLKIEVSTLRGEIEVQNHTINQLKQKQRDLYTDIDRRLQRLESNKTTTDLDTLTTTNEGQNSTAEATGEQLNIETDSNTSTGEEVAEAKPAPDPNKAEAVYQRAFKLLKQQQYDQALQAFKAFLKDYPDSSFSDNAQYWMGEANYVMQKYELAINEYQALLNTFPKSQKVSHALLKIGYSYAELGNAKDARKTLESVMQQYPGTTAARLADERLRKISSTASSS